MADASHEPGAVISGTDLLTLVTAIQKILEGKDLAQYGFVIKGEESVTDSTLTLHIFEIAGITGRPRLAHEQAMPIMYHQGPFRTK